MDRSSYVLRLLDRFRHTPGTSGKVRYEDRRLAQRLFDDHVPIETVEAAMMLATVRRHNRPATAPPLTPIRSLHYFLPVINEIKAEPLIDDLYIEYIRRHFFEILSGSR